MRDVRLLAAAAGLSATGDMVARISLTLHVHAVTGSAPAVAALWATTLVPVVLLAPLAGRLADRVEGVRLLTAVSVLQALVALALTAGASGGVVPILALSAVLAAGSAVAQPAEFALVPAAAGPRLVAANGLVESARYAGFTAGPLLAAVLTAGGGLHLALLLDTASFLAVAGIALALRTRRPPADPALLEPAGRPGRALGGSALLWRDDVLRPVILAATGALLCVSLVLTAEVFYVKDVLHADDSGYALLTAIWMIGMVAGASLVAPRLPARPGLAAWALLALAVQGAAISGQTAWTALGAAFAGFLAGGVAHGAKNALLRALIARRVAQEAHGRAFAAYGALRNAAELGALGIGGLLVAGIGPRAAVAIAGLGPVVAAAAGLLALARGRARRRPYPATLSASSYS